MSLLNRLRGQVRLRVECAFPERVLNLCGVRDLAFWDLEWENAAAFTCRMSCRDFHALSRAAERLECTLTVVGREGAPFFLGRFRHRQALVVGMVGLGLGLFLGSFFVWDYQITGNETVPEERILRALEVYRETGKTISAHNAETRDLPPRYDAVWIGLQFWDRADMKTLIDRRVDAMVAAGLLEEVGQLLESGLPREATALQAIGYKEFLGVLDGTATVEEAVAEVKLRSRQYAKRQLTWLRRNPDIHWIWWEKDRDFARALQVSTEILAAAGVF